jgi:SAM-dependent methyltransferase
METSMFVNFRRFSVMVLLSFFSTVVLAQPQSAKKEYEPSVGQSGKDVVWVPTPQALVDRMLDMAKLTTADVHYDLGSGDGRTVITAAKRGGKAYGIEYNPDMVELARRNAQKEGVADRAIFKQGDIFTDASKKDYMQATVITLFLLPDLNVKLRPTLLDMKPGVRVVSNSFTMGDWKEDEKITAGGDCTSWCTAYLWIIPAKVAGNWKTSRGDLTLKQEYQMLNGNLARGNVTAVISDAKMNGDQIAFTAAGTQYTGRVAGSSMAGTYKGNDGNGSWTATKQ